MSLGSFKALGVAFAIAMDAVEAEPGCLLYKMSTRKCKPYQQRYQHPKVGPSLSLLRWLAALAAVGPAGGGKFDRVPLLSTDSIRDSIKRVQSCVFSRELFLLRSTVYSLPEARRAVRSSLGELELHTFKR
jgi:hypothetical protein